MNMYLQLPPADSCPISCEETPCGEFIYVAALGQVTFSQGNYAVQAMLKPLDVQETKDIETTVAGIRSDKLKEKTASDAAKKGETPLQRASLIYWYLTMY